MRLCLDANVVIGALAGDRAVLVRLAAVEDGDAFISAIVFAEICYGLGHPSRPGEFDALRRLIMLVPVVAFGIEAARAYARVPFGRHRFDRLIAAHALAEAATIATRNAGDFADVPGLAVEDWTGP